MDELVRWLLTLKASDVTPFGAIVAEVVVVAWLLSSDRIVLDSRYREVVADRDRLRSEGEACATAKETDRDEKLQLRQELSQAIFERDWYLRQQEPRP